MKHSFPFFLLAILLTAAFCGRAICQDTLYAEYFTNGVPALSWFDPWTPGQTIGVQFVSGNPSGDGWVGVIENQLSGGGVGTALAGDTSMADYEIQAQIYCTVSSVQGGAYHGVVARWDTSAGSMIGQSYYSFRADYDTDQRLLLSRFPSAMGGSVILAQWVGSQIPGGVPTQNSWHLMSLKCQGDQLWAYWDGIMLSGCPYADTSLTNGFFGCYVFKFSGVAQTLCDDIIVLGTAPPPPATITLTPYGAPIVIPAIGGSFNYNIAGSNQTPSPLNCDVWCNITLPNGTIYGPVLGPVNVTLPGSASINRDRTQNIPSYAPAGTYSFNAYIGDYPGTTWDSDAFPFTKLATGGWGLGAGDWNNTGESFEAVAVGASAAADCAPSSGSGPEGGLGSATPTIQLSPNPFNAATVLSFELRAASFVNLEVFDVSGRLVETVVDGWREAGTHEVIFDGSHLPTGVYVYRLLAGEEIASGKMLLLK